MAGRRVIVTRPAQEAGRWVDALRAAGFDAVSLPLILIAPAGDPAALQAARQRAAQSHYPALMYVSAAAAAHFFADALHLGPGTRCWATGPGTVRGLLDAGVPPEAIDAPGASAAQFDSETLWADVRAQVLPGTHVLIVRGGDAQGRPRGRGWLAEEIVAAGGLVEHVAAYRRFAPAFGAAERALAADDAAVWLFSSAEAIANLRAAMPDAHWRAAHAVTTHPRIAQAASSAGFGQVRVASPTLDALVASIESLA